MGKPIVKKSKSMSLKFSKSLDRNSKAFDEDTAIFITMSQELKEEGNKLFQKRDHEGAMLKYEKALNLLPKSHIDVASLRSNMATCYMQMGLGQYPRAIGECNLALEVAPKYSKALLKRARCYEALDRLDLALRDVNQVLSIEPNNLNALEISESVKTTIGKKSVEFDDKEVVLVPEIVEPTNKKISWKSAKDKVKKKKNKKQVSLKKNDDKKDEETMVVEINKSIKEERTVKFIFGEDIRCAQLAINCDIKALRDVAKDRYSSLKGVLIKYKDQEGDLVTITTTDELRLAEKSCDKKGSLRFYVVDVSPEKDPLYGTQESDDKASAINSDQGKVLENGVLQKNRAAEKGKCSVDDWIIQFARLFKNHVGFDSDSYLDLHEIGMKLYSEAMEDTVTDEDSQKLFEIAAEKFQEMSALALFNWGNVHLSRARKRVFFTEGDKEYILEQVKNAYEWAKREYVKAGSRYTEALKVKPDFYEGLLALGQQQFDQAKLVWYHAIGSEIDLRLGTDTEILQLYNNAEDSIERGVQMWEEREEQRLNGLLKADKYKADLINFGLDGLIKDVTAEEAKEQASNMSSQIYLLWGTMLYERSIVEFKLGLPSWEECLEVAVEKFELAGATQTDIAVMIKNHCSNDSAVDGLGFKIDEIVQAWNEMYDVKRWQTGVPSFRLEPLLRRRVPELHSMLENF